MQSAYWFPKSLEEQATLGLTIALVYSTTARTTQAWLAEFAEQMPAVQRILKQAERLFTAGQRVASSGCTRPYKVRPLLDTQAALAVDRLVSGEFYAG